MKIDERKLLNVGPIPTNLEDLSTWTSQQIRMAGAWSKHEVDAQNDPLTAPYNWYPDWIGELDALRVNQLVNGWYLKNN